MKVTETFFAVEVGDMERARAFYERALGATVSFSSPSWSSLHIAGVRLGLFLNAGREPGRIGLHFTVDDLEAARVAIAAAGGRCGPPTQVAPGVVLMEATDPEDNTFTLRQD